MSVTTDSQKDTRDCKKCEHLFVSFGTCRLPTLDTDVEALGKLLSLCPAELVDVEPRDVLIVVVFGFPSVVVLA
jgi:hypothetical protein